jgi:hypothetical protein
MRVDFAERWLDHTPHYTTLLYTALHCTALHYTTPHLPFLHPTDYIAYELMVKFTSKHPYTLRPKR